MPRLTTILFLACALAGFLTGEIRGQGGPPMLTDDPGTPGNGHLEVNLAATLEYRAHEQSWELPVVDLNYGVGEHIQLNLETAAAVLERDHDGALGGPGAASVALKWRFRDEENGGFDLSTYPRLEWPLARASVRRGLVDDGTRLFLPFEISRHFGIVHLDVEIGPRFISVGRSEWTYGLVAGLPLTSTTEVMAEIHGTARTNLDDDRLTLNAGLHQKLNESVALIVSAGRDVRFPEGERNSFVSYFGLQLTF